LHNRLRIFLICFLFLFLSRCSFAVDTEVKISSSVDKNKLSQDETLTLSIDIAGDISSSPKIQLPDLDKDFEIISTAQSQNVSLKGKQTALSINFKYILLPKKEGKITIGAVTAKYKDQAYKTDPIEIEVTKSKKPKPVVPGPEVPPEEGSEETIL